MKKILTKQEVKAILRIKSDSSRRDMINIGDFPPGFRIGIRRIGWFEDEVIEWINKRIHESRHRNI